MSADLAFINANIKTINPHMPTAQAITITKNRITKVGTNQEIEALIGENTVVLDLEGKTILPGLNRHSHSCCRLRAMPHVAGLNRGKIIAELQVDAKRES